jgi:hypothetical protein
MPRKREAIVRFSVLFVAILVVAVSVPSAAAQKPSKESLIAAWEEIQKADPETKVFEKISNGRYRFKTERFPYDGELVILNTVISPWWSDKDKEDFQGSLEVDFLGMPKEMQEKLSVSLWKWKNETNTLWNRGKAGKWMKGTEYSKAQDAERQFWSHWGKKEWALNLVSLAVVIGLLWFSIYSVKMMRRDAAVRKQLLESSRKNEALLAELNKSVVELLGRDRQDH